MTIRIQYTPGQPGARVFSETCDHEFDTREQAEHFAAIFDKSPAWMGDNLRFGWALGYITKEGEATPSREDTSLIDQVRAAAPLKDGWRWSEVETYTNLLQYTDGLPQFSGTLYFDEYWVFCGGYPERVGFGDFRLPIDVPVTEAAHRLAHHAGALA